MATSRTRKKTSEKKRKSRTNSIKKTQMIREHIKHTEQLNTKHLGYLNTPFGEIEIIEHYGQIKCDLRTIKTMDERYTAMQHIAQNQIKEPIFNNQTDIGFLIDTETF